MSSFAKLALQPSLLKAIESCGYTAPTPIQENAIPVVLAGDDLIGIAGTGTGKTAAFMLPALHRLEESRINNAGGRKTRILALTPTRELAEQITKATRDFAKFGGRTSISSIIGGIPYRRQAASLSPAPDIIIATPGRLIDYLQNKQINLSAVETLVLDEADRMLDMGFIDDVKLIIQATPANRQTLMFSATFDNQIANFARTVLKNPKQISITKGKHQKANIEQRIYMVHDIQQKTKLLNELITSENVFKAIIFSATKRGADKLAKQLCDQGYMASELHGDLRQNQRNAVIDKMRKDKIQFLVATDVAARGLDIEGITHVFNFDFPTYAEDYVHRIGRTGRAGKSGVAISLVLPKDMRHIKQVERFTGQSLAVIKEKGARNNNAPVAEAAPRRQWEGERNNNERRSFSNNTRHHTGGNSNRSNFRSDTRGGFRNDARTDTSARGDFRSRTRTDARGDTRGNFRSDTRNDTRKNFRNNAKPHAKSNSKNNNRYNSDKSAFY